MWKVFPFRELSIQEPSGPRRQTSPALGLVIKALSVTARVGHTPVGEQSLSAPPAQKSSTKHQEPVKAESQEVQ